ncbi:putative glycosyltransferase [Bacillus sp. TS-2]|nr:putative glycosyltransferase [Bacillus sp. TS-2]
MNNLHCGGAEKALISLLENIDYQRFSVDLLLFKKDGLFLRNVTKEVQILKEPSAFSFFDQPITSALSKAFKYKQWKLIRSRLLAGMIFKTESNPAKCEQKVWKYLSRNIECLEKEYDVAIGYLEKNPTYFVIEKVKARKKIGYIHNDYLKLGMDPKIDTAFFQQLDYIVTVSEECAKVLQRVFPEQQKKIKVLYNIVSPPTIQKLANEKIKMLKAEKTLISIGRLTEQKGYDLALLACEQLVKKGLSIKWYVVGEGEKRKELEQMIRDKQLQKHFILLGLKENPYPYMEAADIFVQTSRFEGKSISIDEAKVLQKPILVTNFSTVNDQIQHKENGYIVEMNPNAICLGLEELFENEELRTHLVSQLANQSIQTEVEMNKFYQLFEVG